MAQQNYMPGLFETEHDYRQKKQAQRQQREQGLFSQSAVGRKGAFLNELAQTALQQFGPEDKNIKSINEMQGKLKTAGQSEDPYKAYGSIARGLLQDGNIKGATQAFQLQQSFKPEKADKRVIEEGADGYKYYVDTNERVFPDVKKPEDSSKSVKPVYDTVTATIGNKEVNLRRRVKQDGTPEIYFNGKWQDRSKLPSQVEIGKAPNNQDLSVQQYKSWDTFVQKANDVSGAITGTITGAGAMIDIIKEGSGPQGIFAPLQHLAGKLATDLGAPKERVAELVGDPTEASKFMALHSDQVLDEMFQLKGTSSEGDRKVVESVVADISDPREAALFKAKYARELALQQQTIHDYARNSDPTQWIKTQKGMSAIQRRIPFKNNRFYSESVQEAKAAFGDEFDIQDFNKDWDSL